MVTAMWNILFFFFLYPRKPECIHTRKKTYLCQPCCKASISPGPFDNMKDSQWEETPVKNI